jgi:hypothetical protein
LFAVSDQLFAFSQNPMSHRVAERRTSRFFQVGLGVKKLTAES